MYTNCTVAYLIMQNYCLINDQPTILQRAMRGKGDTSLILAIISFIGCFFCTLCVSGAAMICHIPAMLFAAKVSIHQHASSLDLYTVSD